MGASTEVSVEDTGPFRETIALPLKLIGMGFDWFVDLAVAEPVDLEISRGRAYGLIYWAVQEDKPDK